MKQKRGAGLLAVLLGLTLVFTSCGSPAKPEAKPEEAKTAEAAPEKKDEPKKEETKEEPKKEEAKEEAKPAGKMTDVGTPRNETLIVDILSGKSPNPNLMNPYLPGSVAQDAGLHQLIHSHLWEIDTIKGEQFPELAAEMPQAMDDTNTKFKFKVREGLKWSDGVDFTAADIEFTGNMILNTKELAMNGSFSKLIKSMKATDPYTIEIETVTPQAKLATRLGVTIWGQGFRIMPKHVWEKEDPLTFQYSDPLSVTPYKLAKRDPEGYWYLYEKRDDWQNTTVGQITGKEAGPKYILFKSYGPEEKRIMAAINHDIDILQDITPESWDILRQKNPTAKAWYDHFPYADTNDPCERGMEFNTALAPYDNPDVRWALALATDIKNVSMASFGGMLRVSPLQVPPVDVLQETYHKPMTPWLKDFALEDGYKPFDESYAKDMVEMLKEQGIEGLPTTEEEMINTFGVGWWKYDVEQAAKLLEKNKFTRGADGKWILPDGKPWVMTILAPANFEIQSMRLAFAVADTWRKFGVDVNVQQMDSATFWTSEGNGSFEVGSYWPACGIIPDTSINMNGWHKNLVVPIGTIAPGNPARWANDRVSQLLEESQKLGTDDPKVIENVTEINKEFVKGIPFLPMFGTSKFVPVDTYYWEGFQTADNAFEGPWWWWSQFKYYTPNYKPTGK